MMKKSEYSFANKTRDFVPKNLYTHVSCLKNGLHREFEFNTHAFGLVTHNTFAVYSGLKLFYSNDTFRLVKIVTTVIPQYFVLHANLSATTGTVR